MYKKIFVVGVTILFLSIILIPSCNSNFLSGKVVSKIKTKISNDPNKNPLGLELGDIVFKHPKVFPDRFPTMIPHSLLFVSYNPVNDTYLLIEAGAYVGVQYTFETKENLTGEYYGPFARVKTADSIQKKNAIDFAKTQLGKKFQSELLGIEADKNHDPSDPDDPFADEWYCSEIVWAAYYNCNNSFAIKKPEDEYIYGEGIDLDRNGWKKNVYGHTLVRPKEILNNRKHVKKIVITDREDIARNKLFEKNFHRFLLKNILSFIA